MTWHTCYLLLGSNIGNRYLHLQQGLSKISATAGNVVRVSTVYETEPWGVSNQDLYLNMAVMISTELTPEALHHQLKAIEVEEGRTGTEKNAPRTLDIDILFYDDLSIVTSQLIIPHPRLHLRKFVLLPLSEIAPQHMHPLLNKSVTSLLAACDDDKSVRKAFQDAQP